MTRKENKRESEIVKEPSAKVLAATSPASSMEQSELSALDMILKNPESSGFCLKFSLFATV